MKPQTKLLLNQQALNEVIVQNSMDLIMVIDLDGWILSANPASMNLLGYPSELITDQNLYTLTHEEDRDFLSLEFARSVAGGRMTVTACLRIQHKDGGWIYLETLCRLTLSEQGKILCVMNARDVTTKIGHEAELEEQAFTDALTGLHNRRSFTHLLTQQILVANRQKQRFHLLMADLNGLKSINDQFGHAEGDIAIKCVGDALRGTFRNADAIARIGGDEFVVILTGFVDSDFSVMLRRLSRAFLLQEFAHKNRYPISASIGIVSYNPFEPSSPADLLQMADTAMYASKRSAKNPSETEPDKEALRVAYLG